MCLELTIRSLFIWRVTTIATPTNEVPIESILMVLSHSSIKPRISSGIVTFFNIRFYRIQLNPYIAG
jgi:hypothetical protein